MANKEYQWRATTDYRSTTTMSHGVTPSTQESWQTANSGEVVPATTYAYWYRDSNTSWQGEFQDVLSSRVVVSVTQTWTTSVDNRNNLTVTITTTVDSIVRDDIRAPAGYSDSNTPGRNISLYKEQGGASVFSTTDNQVATAHTILGSPLNIGSETFTIAPGDTTIVKSSLYLHNQTVGMSSYEDIWIGIQFRNPLPPDYIPGKIWDGSDWLSHNRATNGHAKQYTGSAWSDDMKTVDGPTGTGDPPTIKHSDGWHNQRLTGQE